MLLKMKRLDDERKLAESQREVALEELKKSNDELDRRVRERTVELAKTNEMLQADIIKRKQAEYELRDSEVRLNLALGTNNTGVWDLNLLDHTAYRTLIHDRIFGYETLLPSWTYEMFLEHVLPRIVRKWTDFSERR